MSTTRIKGEIKEITIEAVKTRADGTTEDLGMLSYKHSNPLKTAWWYLGNPKQLRHKVGKFFKSIFRSFAHEV